MPNPLTANTASTAHIGGSAARIRNLGAPASRKPAKNTIRRRNRWATAAAIRLPQTAAIPIDKADQGGTAAHFTRPGNYLGLCGVAVPSGFTREGLPTSLQILCHAGAEAMALRIAWGYEQATGFTSRRPPEP